MATTRKAAETATEPGQELQTAPQDVREGIELIDYTVAGCKRLRLREEPSLDAPVVAVLPCGVGVLGSASPAENGWRQVFTGRLFGWVMDKFLEPLELSNDTE